MSVAIELDQPLVTDPEVMRDLVEHNVSDLLAQTIGVAGSESRYRPAEDADLVGKHSAVRAAPSRQRYTAVQAEQRPPVGRLVLDDDLNVAHRRTEIGRQGAQRVVNRLFERIVETRLRTRIHLRNDARIGAGRGQDHTDQRVQRRLLIDSHRGLTVSGQAWRQRAWHWLDTRQESKGGSLCDGGHTLVIGEVTDVICYRCTGFSH
jgi:hypothetical protein